MKAKLLLQILSRKQVGWDDPLPDDEQAQWSRWLEDIPKLQEVKISCCFKPCNFDEIKVVQLHLFSDASRVGYAAVAYLRLVDTGGNSNRLSPQHLVNPRISFKIGLKLIRLSFNPVLKLIL